MVCFIRYHNPSTINLQDIKFPKGTELNFDKNGKLRDCILSDSTLIEGIKFPKGTKIHFYENGMMERCRFFSDTGYYDFTSLHLAPGQPVTGFGKYYEIETGYNIPKLKASEIEFFKYGYSAVSACLLYKAESWIIDTASWIKDTSLLSLFKKDKEEIFTVSFSGINFVGGDYISFYPEGKLKKCCFLRDSCRLLNLINEESEITIWREIQFYPNGNVQNCLPNEDI